MSEMVYRYSREQRRAVLGSALILGVWAAAITVHVGVLVRDHRIGDAIGEWSTLGLAPLLLSALTVALARGTTRIDDQGLHASSAGRNWHCSWAEIQSVETTSEVARGNVITRVRIRRSNGRPFKLPAPYDSQTIGRDPDFDRKVAQIEKKWRAGRKS